MITYEIQVLAHMDNESCVVIISNNEDNKTSEFIIDKDDASIATALKMSGIAMGRHFVKRENEND